jgi:hypothetical protein
VTRLVINLLYGDFAGGQRVISQFSLRHARERWLTQATRHFSVDRPDPRQGIGGAARVITAAG